VSTSVEPQMDKERNTQNDNTLTTPTHTNKYTDPRDKKQNKTPYLTVNNTFSNKTKRNKAKQKRTHRIHHMVITYFIARLTRERIVLKVLVPETSAEHATEQVRVIASRIRRQVRKVRMPVCLLDENRPKRCT
jgi:hypothetical protein